MYVSAIAGAALSGHNGGSPLADRAKSMADLALLTRDALSSSAKPRLDVEPEPEPVVVPVPETKPAEPAQRSSRK